MTLKPLSVRLTSGRVSRTPNPIIISLPYDLCVRETDIKHAGERERESVIIKKEKVKKKEAQGR